jgi:AraC-like DNA-binding protein
MKITVRNMICPECKFFVQAELERHGINYASIESGEVELTNSISEQQLNELKLALQAYGMDIVDKVKLIKKIKNAVRELVYNPELETKLKLSEYVSQRVKDDYNFLNGLFIGESGMSIEKYFTAKKVERAIELLIYYNLNLTEITYQLNFNSISHLSNQFKTVTGMSPLRYKKGKNIKSIISGIYEKNQRSN